MRGSSVSSPACPMPGSMSPRPISSSGRRQDRRWLPRSPAGHGRPNCMPPSSPRCLGHRLATPDRTGDALRISRGRTTWSGRTESSVLLRMRPTCAAGWAPRRSRWMLPTALARRAGATSSRLGFPASTGRNSLCLSRLSMRIPGNRSCSTATAESIWWTPSPPAPATASAVPPYRIGENRYINGGYRRSENADLAAGYGRVLVLSPFGGRSRMPLEWGMDLATQVDELRAGGSRVETVFPDGGAGDVFDANAMDPSTRPQAARGGYDQGRALAEQLAEFWR